MAVKLKKINLHAFRGIRDLELELEGKNLLLQGDNGTGKSAIVEGLEFFCTGTVSRLEGVRGLSPRKHIPHVDFTAEDVQVTITFDPGNVSLTRTFSVEPEVPAQLESYLRVTQKGTFILHRSQLLEFILSQPADRFRAIGSIIGIEPLDVVELEMMRVRDTLNGELQSRTKERTRLLQEVSRIIGKEIERIDEVLPLLNERLREANLPMISSLADAEEHAESMLRKVKKTESSENIAALNEMRDLAKNPFVEEPTIEDVNSLNEQVKCLLQDEVKSELELVNLLKTGRTFIHEQEARTCPLCEQPIEREIVLSRIDTRLTTLRELSSKASEVRRTSVQVIDGLRRICDRMESVIPKTKLFGELSDETAKLSQSWSSLKTLTGKVVSAGDLTSAIPVEEFRELTIEVKNLTDSISQKCGRLLDLVGLTEQEKQVLEIVRVIQQLASKARDMERVNGSLKAYDQYAETAEKIYSSFSDAKKAKIQEVYNSIQGNVETFYTMLHPQEPHKNIELTIALGRRASTEMKIESFGRPGEDPRALTSEGHLDSLGLCIFLAFVKKFNEDCPLIVLDDVVATVDATHRENICRLLHEQFPDKQLIITTCDGVWYEQLCASQRAYRVDGNFKNLSIVGWSVETGPRIRPYKPRWEKIQEKIERGDKTGAGNEARQYLEWVLEELCRSMEALVPVKGPRGYEIGHLFDPAKKRLEKLLKEDDFKRTAVQAFRDLERTVIMGNILSHNNLLAGSVSMNEIRSFCSCVNNLNEVFLCPTCRHPVRYYRELAILRCSNHKCTGPIEVKTK